MSDPAAVFAAEAAGVATADVVREGEFVHVYRGELDATDGTVRFLTLAPDVANDDVAAAFTRAAAQWRNPSTHPNVVTVHDQGDRPRPWLVTDDVSIVPDWEPLPDAQSDLTPAKVRTVIAGAAEAVRNAKLYNTTHAALAPERVWVVDSPSGVAGLVDEWGLERACRRAAGEQAVTPYTAPELVGDSDGVTDQTDVYGLGAVTYYALTGRPPVDPDADLAAAIPESDPAPPSELNPDVPAAVDDAVLRALSVAPEDRYPSAHALSAALGDALPEAPEADLSGQAGPAGPLTMGTESEPSGSPTPDSRSGSDSGTATDDDRSLTRRAALGVLGLGAVTTAGWGAAQFLSDPESISAGDESGGVGPGLGADAITATPQPADDGRSALAGEEVRLAVLSPESRLDELGHAQIEGAELAIQRVNESDEFPFTIEGAFVDTEAAPGQAHQHAAKLASSEGVDFFAGGFVGSVATTVAGLAAQQEVVYVPTTPLPAVTGSECNEWTFRVAPNLVQTARAAGAYAADSLGSNAWFLYADYEYGRVSYEWAQSIMSDRDDDFEAVDTYAVEPGQGDYGAFVERLANADADVAVVALGPDDVNFLRQVREAGVTEDVSVISPTMTPRMVRDASEGALNGTYRVVRWHPSIDRGHNRRFVSEHGAENGSGPTLSVRIGYDSVLTIAEGIRAAASTDPEAVRDALDGGTVTTAVGDVRLRESDHQATAPVWIGEVVDGEDGPETELRGRPLEGPETLPDAAELGCSLD